MRPLSLSNLHSLRIIIRYHWIFFTNNNGVYNSIELSLARLIAPPPAPLSRASFVSLPLTLFFTIAHRLALKCADTLTTDCWHFVSLLSSVEPTLYNLDNWHCSLLLFHFFFFFIQVLWSWRIVLERFGIFICGVPVIHFFYDKFVSLFFIIIIIHDTDVAFPSQLS